MPAFQMAYPVKMWGRYDGTDAKGRDIHFDDDLYEGQIVGNLRKTRYKDPAPPYGKVQKQPNGETWIVACDESPRAGRPQPKFSSE